LVGGEAIIINRRNRFLKGKERLLCAEACKLEVTGEPERMDEMTKNFAVLVKREFSED
jgi:hypothetical protein